MQGSSNCRPSPTAQSDSSPSSSSGTSLPSLTSSSSPSYGPFLFSCHSSSSLYSSSSASSIFSASFMSSSSSSPLPSYSLCLHSSGPYSFLFFIMYIFLNFHFSSPSSFS